MKHRRGGAHGADFVERKFAGEHYLRESGFFEHGGACRRTGVALRAGVQGYRRQLHAQIGHVLHYEGVDAGIVQLAHERFHGGNLGIVDYGVHSHIDARIEAVGELGGAGYVGHGVAGGCTRAECGRAYVHGVGAAEDGVYGDVGITRRREQFEWCGVHASASSKVKASAREASVSAGSWASLLTTRGMPAASTCGHHRCAGKKRPWRA